MNERIGFVGVWGMGVNMARRLKECGFTITAVWDVTKKQYERMVTESLRELDNPGIAELTFQGPHSTA